MITLGCPGRYFFRKGAMIRALVSNPPPGVKGTIKLMFDLGNFPLTSGAAHNIAAPRIKERVTNTGTIHFFIRIPCISAPPGFACSLTYVGVMNIPFFPATT
jgi:hypothetical protein